MTNKYHECTPLRLTTSDLHTIRRVLHSYSNELGRSDPPLLTTNELLKTMETMCERIAVATPPRASKTPNELLLSPNELTIVDRALMAYVVSLGQSVPPSEERDEIMRGCEALRVQIMASRMSSDPPSP